MMNFEERRAEIFRRSDERIKIRKQNRKRILLSTMSLVIFVSVISAVAVYPLTKESYWEDGIGESSDIDIYFYSLAYPVTVELTDLDNGETRYIEDCYNIAGVTDIIFSITEGRDRLDSYGIHTESTDDGQRKDMSNTVFYEITITREPPENEIIINTFILNGNILTDKKNQQEYQLTDTELEELLFALGLAD